ncbi:MAG: hypothetical protein NTV68_16645 [Methanomicrobiales archaeon]|nr:hypothetical protein [Methanomicrobiales archaeon]
MLLAYGLPLTCERPAIDISQSLHMLLEFSLPDISLLENCEQCT